MVNNISWGSYWSALSILVLFYYAYVLWVYYRGDIFRRLAAGKAISPASPFPGSNKQEENVTDELLPVAQSFGNEVSAYLGQAAYAKAGKTEIIFALQQIRKKYEVIKNSSYQQAVNSLIQFECEDKSGVHLNEEEVKQVWLD